MYFFLACYFILTSILMASSYPTGEVKREDHSQENYFRNLIAPQTHGLEKDLSYIALSQCPNELLQKHRKSIRFYLRSFYLSRLYEGLLHFHQEAYRLNLITKSCHPEVKSLFRDCKPQTGLMRSFLYRSQNAFREIKSYYPFELPKREYRENLKKTLKSSQSFVSLQLKRSLGDKPLNQLATKDINQAVGEVCGKIRELIGQVCSEQDYFYGLSGLDKLPSAIIIIPDESSEVARACYQRYRRQYQPLEISSNYLLNFIQGVEENLIKNKIRSEGRLFSFGALEQFAQKGLDQFLYSPPEKKKEAKKEKRIKLQPKKKRKIIAFSLPKEVKKTKAKKEHLSEFERAKRNVEKTGRQQKLNTEKLISDLGLKSKEIDFLAKNIKPFEDRQALLDFKNYENFGEYQAPVRLSFLLYLIQEEKKEVLNNFIEIIGENFYLKNDRENKSDPVWSELSYKKKWELKIKGPSDEDPT